MKKPMAQQEKSSKHDQTKSQSSKESLATSYLEGIRKDVLTGPNIVKVEPVKYGSLKKLQEVFSSSEMSKIRTVEDVVNNPLAYPTLSMIKKEFSEEKMIAFLVFILCDLVEFFNVGKSMNATQIKQTARLIFEEYPYMRIHDFRVCFTNAKKGLYGKVYDRIDGSIIMEWLLAHADDRGNLFEQRSITAHNQSKDPGRVLPFHQINEKYYALISKNQALSRELNVQKSKNQNNSKGPSSSNKKKKSHNGK